MGLEVGTFGQLDLKNKPTLLYMLLFSPRMSLPLCAMDYQKSEVFYVGGWVNEEVKCLVGILCHCQLLSKMSCFVSARSKLRDSLR